MFFLRYKRLEKNLVGDNNENEYSSDFVNFQRDKQDRIKLVLLVLSWELFVESGTREIRSNYIGTRYDIDIFHYLFEPT